MNTEVSKHQGEQEQDVSPMAELTNEPSFEDLKEERAMMGEISKVGDRNTRELLIACLPLFYRNYNPNFQDPVQYRGEIINTMLEYPAVQGKELISFSKYMQNKSQEYAKEGDGKRAHMYSVLAEGKGDDQFALPHGYFAQMEVGNEINKDIREHNGRATYSINDYRCYEIYKDRLKQGEEIIEEFQTVK